MRTLKEFLRFYFQHLDQFETRIKAFRINRKSRILEELVFCLCTPQTSPLKADLATKRIVSYYEKV
ncbi:MAG: hypothetical protein N2654_07965, partial [Deltaproteobacteria bacterium]|nr:hypothetical protein [Deltaproteobacteria bacterium]